MSSLVIIKTGDAFPEVVDAHGDFEQLFIRPLREALPMPTATSNSFLSSSFTRRCRKR